MQKFLYSLILFWAIWAIYRKVIVYSSNKKEKTMNKKDKINTLVKDEKTGEYRVKDF
ncbi:hypothetical protein B488_00670 [Liberibacter crescens BT-1]|uniref:Uncharacterized protein n=1 Tax=Liberibacter crescens (strain BT-1) TaxID=1215343 RepID=L0ETB5_LIBCB|nr:hypothetical protein [Liberibacter crescens]AGA64060.1 hypothetical protein B488_00670 [Liberibacter crescens BT-1]